MNRVARPKHIFEKKVPGKWTHFNQSMCASSRTKVLVDEKRLTQRHVVGALHDAGRVSEEWSVPCQSTTISAKRSKRSKGIKGIKRIKKVDPVWTVSRAQDKNIPHSPVSVASLPVGVHSIHRVGTAVRESGGGGRRGRLSATVQDLKFLGFFKILNDLVRQKDREERSSAWPIGVTEKHTSNETNVLKQKYLTRR